uniref:Uncharacterized protein n=1 Tax=Siphoviridae sp. ctPrm3 TaxID=2827864 RepID=A0A8S5TPB3_9CAUD|nr:MAG TPA: hypothetical protein [Siphoviridae sp. ctPrm3]
MPGRRRPARCTPTPRHPSRRPRPAAPGSFATSPERPLARRGVDLHDVVGHRVERLSAVERDQARKVGGVAVLDVFAERVASVREELENLRVPLAGLVDPRHYAAQARDVVRQLVALAFHLFLHPA